MSSIRYTVPGIPCPWNSLSLEFPVLEFPWNSPSLEFRADGGTEQPDPRPAEAGAKEERCQ
jgi:hypothetical protein